MLNHLELFHKFMTDKISAEEKRQLKQQLKTDAVLAEEFSILKALKTAVRRNLLTRNMNYLKHIEKTLRDSDQPPQSSRGKIIAFLMCYIGSCA